MKQFTLSQDSNGEWTVTCPRVPGLVIRAKTKGEAIEKMKRAVALYYPCGDCEGTSRSPQ